MTTPAKCAYPVDNVSEVVADVLNGFILSVLIRRRSTDYVISADNVDNQYIRSFILTNASGRVV